MDIIREDSNFDEPLLETTQDVAIVQDNNRSDERLLTTSQITSDVETLAPPESIPDGGSRAWCTVLGGWLALFATFGHSSSYGVYQDLYTRAGTSSFSNISWIGSTQLFLFIALGLPAGKLVDTGYFAQVVFVGSIIYVFSMFMLSFAHIDRYYQLFLSQGVGMGIGIGLIYLPCLTVQAHHWKRRRALAMGIVITGSSVGGIIYPIMLNHLFHDSVGFALGVRVATFLTMTFLLAANLLMTARLPSTHRTLKKAGSNPSASAILRDRSFLVLVLGAFFVIWGIFFAYFYLQLFTILHGLSTNLAFYQLTIQNAASIFGRTLPNIIADKAGPVNVLIVVSFATGVLVFSLLGIDSNGGIIVFSILYGFFSGAVLSLFAPCIASFSRDVNEVGVRIGIAAFFTSFAYLIGTPISGALLNDGTHWYRPIILNGTVILAGVPLMIMSQVILAGRKQTQHA